MFSHSIKKTVNYASQIMGCLCNFLKNMKNFITFQENTLGL